MAQILCKQCGTLNDPGMASCSFCHQPLQVPDDGSEGMPLGGVPARKPTGELEPILPKWLRDARAEAISAQREIDSGEDPSDGLKPAQEGERPRDLLAGLEDLTRAEQDDEIPAWLGNMVPSSVTPPNSKPKPPEDDLGGLPEGASSSQEPAIDPSEISDQPDAEKAAAPSPVDPLDEWLSALSPDEVSSGQSASGGTHQDDSDLPDWMKLSDDVGASKQPAVPKAPLPDWLSNLLPANEKPGSTGTPEMISREPIVPGDLPSWVQALRPVESALPDAGAAFPQPPVEEKGPLAGLPGILNLAGGFIQPGRSKAQAFRLQVTEAQGADASLLEKMLVSETEPEPLRGTGMLVSQPVLRWVLSFLLIGLISFFLVLGMGSVPLPVSSPAEADLIRPVLEALPENAPVLVIFDYEPALAGELEFAAAPLVDHLLDTRHPRLTILSTSPIGSALAERFLDNTQSRHAYQLNQDYIDLGYLPGGSIGIASFAENPRLTLPFPGWDQPPAQAVHALSDFSAIILLTDQAETVRVWVEQTAGKRDGVPLLVVASALAAPMIQPWLLSGQVNGLLGGVQGAAAFGGPYPGISTGGFWDAFNFATLLVALLMVLGAIWNLIAGARARRRPFGGT